MACLGFKIVSQFYKFRHRSVGEIFNSRFRNSFSGKKLAYYSGMESSPLVLQFEHLINHRSRATRLVLLLGLLFFSLSYKVSYSLQLGLGDLGRETVKKGRDLLFHSRMNKQLDKRLIKREGVLDFVISDFRKNNSSEFSIPVEIEEDVKFWTKIYTQYSSNQVLIVDSEHLNIIYDVIQVSPSSGQTPGQFISENLARYRNAMLALSHHSKPKTATPEQKIILSKIKSLTHKHRFQQLAQTLKAVRGQKDVFWSGLQQFDQISPSMEQAFESLNIPKALTRLSLTESALDINAVSKVGAAGLWQFMPSIGKRFGLIDKRSGIDYRFSPARSTVAAGKLLLWNYEHLGNWILAITAYNHGLRGLPKIRNLDSSRSFKKIAYLFNHCSKKSPLGWASRNYFSEFLAAMVAESYREYLF